MIAGGHERAPRDLIDGIGEAAADLSGRLQSCAMFFPRVRLPVRLVAGFGMAVAQIAIWEATSDRSAKVRASGEEWIPLFMLSPETEWGSKKEYLEHVARWASDLWDLVSDWNAGAGRRLDRLWAEPMPRRRPTDRHIAWLARYQLGRESFEAIADSAGFKRQSVDEAIQTAARLLNLPLRPPSSVGRPKRHKT